MNQACWVEIKKNSTLSLPRLILRHAGWKRTNMLCLPDAPMHACTTQYTNKVGIQAHIAQELVGIQAHIAQEFNPALTPLVVREIGCKPTLFATD